MSPDPQQITPDQPANPDALGSHRSVEVKVPKASDPTPDQPNTEPQRPSPRRIALMNQKGGVGKTTTAVNLGAALTERGQRVLMIDMDPQAHLTLHLGVDPASLERTVYDLIVDPTASVGDVVYEVRPNLVLLPAEVNLAGVEGELAPLAAKGKAQGILREKCDLLIRDDQWFDHVLIDCPPSLGLLTVNALALATEVMVPMQAHFLALQGLSKLFETVRLVKQAVNPGLVVSGVILCMHEAQTILAGEVVADLRSFLEAGRDADEPWSRAEVFDPAVRRNIKLAECAGFGKTIFDYAPQCAGAHDYRALADAVCTRHAANQHA